MFDGNFRSNVDRVLDPIGAGLCRIGVTANALTAAGIVVAAIGAIVIGQGNLFLGFIFLALVIASDFP